MSVVVTARLFTDEFTEAGGGGVSYPNSGVLARNVVEVDFYSYLAFVNKNLTFDAATKTISNADVSPNFSFLDYENKYGKGLRAGMTIAVEDTGLNNGTYTIVSVTATVITVVEALVNETDATSSIYDDTPITALDFYYNLIENTLQESYLSLTDRGAIQRFTVDGIDASDLVTETNMLVASSSFGWVTNEITNLLTGETTEVKIIGMGITDHRQAFKITQQFSIAPFTTRQQLINFQNKFAPDYFVDGKALKYINRVDAKFEFTDPDIPHTGSLIIPNGLTNWFDQNNIRSLPEYYVESIAYQDAATSLPLERLDLNKVNNVEIVLKSRNGKFLALTEFALDFLYIPLDEADYIDTQETTLRQNLMNDRRFWIPFFGPLNGEYFGTDYQVLTTINRTLTNVNTLTITFKVDLSTYLKDILKSKSDDNRNYAISVTTQDATIVTTRQTDNVPVLCDVQNMDWDKENPDLLEAVDDLRVYRFPDIESAPSNDVAGWEGDPIYMRFPFRLASTAIEGITPTIMRVGFQLIVYKAGEDEFVLEEKIFDTSLVRKLSGIQTINFSETRPFRDTEPDYETTSIIRDATLDIGVMMGFVMSYAFILRYEFWLKLIQDSERFRYSLFDDIESPTHSWHTLMTNGWSLKVKFICDVKGYDDFVTEYWQYFNMRALEVGSPPDSPPIFTSTTKYYTEDGATEVNGIIIGGKTKIIFTCTGDFSIMPAGYDGFFGYFFADLEDIGGITNRRFASTEFNSENLTFTATPVDPLADSSHASDNVTINIYNFTTIVIETIYDDSIGLWSSRARAILIYPELGFKAIATPPAGLRAFSDLEAHLWADGEQSEFAT